MARTDRWADDRRTEYRYGDRWHDDDPDERRHDERDGANWPRVSEEDDADRGPQRPIVNPYAVIALVAALLLLFPVALVFGLIAFGHPRGKGMAVLALLLGIAEVAVIAAFVVLGGSGWNDMLDRAENSLLSASETLPQAPVTTAALAPTAAPTVITPPAEADPSGTPVAARKGASCAEVETGTIGTAADGSTLLCLEKSGGQSWTGPYTITTAVHEPGGSCDPRTARSARTADGRALICESGARGTTWVLWLSE